MRAGGPYHRIRCLTRHVSIALRSGGRPKKTRTVKTTALYTPFCKTLEDGTVTMHRYCWLALPRQLTLSIDRSIGAIARD